MFKLNFGLLPKDIDNIKKTIKKFPEIEFVKIFGSRALGNYKKGSDIDIAILGDKVTDETLLKFSRLLNEELPIPYFCDVLNYNKINNIELKKHIDKIGKKIEVY